jgi:transmembrane sensor
LSEHLFNAEPPIPPERLAEASIWVARLNNGEQDKATLQGVKQWLHAHPMNRRALGLCAEVWEDSGRLRRILPVHDELPLRPRSMRAVYGLAACLAAAAIGLFIWFRPGPELVTDLGEQRTVTLKDGTHVSLNTSTRLTVQYNSKARIVRLKEGEALFEVAKRPDWPFIVLAGDRRITALGTTLDVEQDGMKTTVTLVEGKITVTAARAEGKNTSSGARSATVNSSFTLAPGQRLTWAAGKARLDNTSKERTTAWRLGQVIFDDTPLDEAAAEMNRYSTTRIVVEGEAAKTLLVTGLFQSGNSASFAHAVAETHGLRMEEHDHEIMLRGALQPSHHD